MDSIANAVSDACEPQIVPDIEPYTINDKTIIVVTVLPEPQRPYYLKSRGKEKGTYIRVGATTRQASLEKIKELEMEGEKISWDELACVGYKVTESAIKKLCRDINSRRKEMQEHKNRKDKLSIVTRTNLENWKVLRKSNDSYIASNAFVLLTSDYFPFSKTQCAVFKGTERNVFLDKREYTGPLYEQIGRSIIAYGDHQLTQSKDICLRFSRKQCKSSAYGHLILLLHLDGLVKRNLAFICPFADAHKYRQLDNAGCKKLFISLIAHCLACHHVFIIESHMALLGFEPLCYLCL